MALPARLLNGIMGLGGLVYSSYNNVILIIGNNASSSASMSGRITQRSDYKAVAHRLTRVPLQRVAYVIVVI